MISRKQRFGIVDFSEGDSDSDDSIKYFCKHCEKYGIKVRLGNRIYLEGEPISKEDAESWKMCFECGSLYATFELEKESSIKDVVETSDNPFDVAKNTFLGIDKRTSVGGKNARKRRLKKLDLDDIKDDDVKRELKKGHTLLSYSEEMPQ